MFNVHNIRIGFATNSSSSHSIIFPATPLAKSSSENYDNSFGWDEFVLKSPEAKRRYLAATIHSHYYQLPKGIIRAICQDWLGVKDDEMDVDHQSRYMIPTSFGTDLPDEEFIKAFAEFLEKDDVVIVGGNDNDEPSELNNQGGLLPIPRESSGYSCRRDGDYWVLFSKYTGAKIRFSFNAPKLNNMLITELNPTAPELVDVKITDFCPYDCPFCYMGSTTKGKHADYEFLAGLAYEFKQSKIFEIAIGGGEPTLHPKFKEIVELFHSYGVVVNFTTKNLEWIKNPLNAAWANSHVGAIAFSVENEKEIQKVKAAFVQAGVDTTKGVIQAIIGPGCIEYTGSLVKIIEEADKSEFNLTLLGYKRTGRGAEFEKKHLSVSKDKDWWLKAIIDWKKKNKYSRSAIGIDSVLAKEYENELMTSGISREFYYTSEGVYSCYVDAVEKKLGPSSFAPDKMIPLDGSRYSCDLIKKFQELSRKN